MRDNPYIVGCAVPPCLTTRPTAAIMEPVVVRAAANRPGRRRSAAATPPPFPSLWS